MEYETRLIAFVDFLGFKKMIEESENNPMRIGEVYSAIHSIYRVLWDYLANSPGDTTLRITHFSDSIVMSCVISEIEEVVLIIRNLRYIQQKLVEDHSMLIRGAITIGDLIHDDHILMGPAMVEAYTLESTVAKYPRIIVEDLAKQVWDMCTKLLNVSHTPDNQFMLRDSDGQWYIDYINDLDHNFYNG
ncbi:MAG: hypothetical protein ACI4B3_10400 [Prevotella sp.]